jgi:hypothetical protein
MTAVTVYLRLKYAKNCSKTLSDWNDILTHEAPYLPELKL